MKEFGATGRKAAYLVRELFACGREASFLAADCGDEAYIRSIAAAALYPETPVLSFTRDGEEEKSEAELDLERESGDFFHIANTLRSKMRIQNLIACGGVDDGKSTLIGRILYEVEDGAGKERIRNHPDFLRTDKSVDYALLAGVTKEEASQGITVRVSYSAFDWGGESFLIADVPGHEEYAGAMARAASAADTAVIMLSARKGIVPQTARHVRICSFMGIRNMVFAVNKMDAACYDESVFLRISDEIGRMMEAFPDTEAVIVPVAAKSGENIARPSDRMPWHAGPALLDALAGRRVKGRQERETRFLMPVQRICKSSQMEGAVVPERVLQGEVALGEIRAGDEVLVYPSKERARIASVFCLDQKTGLAKAGSPAGITLDRELCAARGSVLAGGDVLFVTDCVEAEVFWVSDSRLTRGKRYRVMIGTTEAVAAVTKIYDQTDVGTGERRLADCLARNDLARCEICFPKPVPLTCERKCRALGTIRLYDRQNGSLAAYGNIIHTVSTGRQKEEGQAVLAGEREAALGQKAGLALFSLQDGARELMNYAERHLLRFGFHTAQLAPQGTGREIYEALRCLLDSGLIVLFCADLSERDAAAKLIAAERVFDCAGNFDFAKDAWEIARRIRKWAANLV